MSHDLRTVAIRIASLHFTILLLACLAWNTDAPQLVTSGNLASAQVPPPDAFTPVPRTDCSFSFASTDRSLPGVALGWNALGRQHLFGTVKDESGRALPNAEVWFAGFVNGIPLREKTKADANGAFQIGLPFDKRFDDHHWKAFATASDLRSVPIDVKSDAGELHFIVSIGRQLHLRVFQAPTIADAAPLPVSTFALHFEDGRIVSSDTSNECIVHAVPADVQGLTITAPGYTPRHVLMDFYENRQYKLDVNLDAGRTIEGTVVDDDHRPATLVRVRSNFIGHPFAPEVGLAITNSQGRYRMSGISASKQNLFVDAGEGDQIVLHQEQPIEALGPQSQTVSDIVLEKYPPFIPPNLDAGLPNPGRGFLKGKVLMPDGSACQAFELRIDVPRNDRARHLYQTPSLYGLMGISYRNPTGEFIFSGAMREIPLRATVIVPGLRHCEIDSIVPISENRLSKTAPTVFQLDKPIQKVTLNILDVDHRPISNAEVTFFKEGVRELGDRSGYLAGLATALTDEQGIATLEGLLLDVGSVLVRANGFPEQKFPWMGDSIEPILLQRGVNLSVRFKASLPRIGQLETGQIETEQIAFEDDGAFVVEIRQFNGRFVGRFTCRDVELNTLRIPNLLPGKYGLQLTYPPPAKTLWKIKPTVNDKFFPLIGPLRVIELQKDMSDVEFLVELEKSS